MSRNFEVLKRLEIEGEARSAATVAARVADGGSRAFTLPTDARLPEADPRIAAEMKKLIERLFRSDRKDAPRVVVFAPVERTSAANGICAHAGTSLAQQSGASVCILDTNVASPSLHYYFDLPNNGGISDTVKFADKLGGHRVAGLDLTIITAGSTDADWEKMTSSAAMAERMRELRSQYDYVLIDAAPLSLSISAAVLGKMADGLLMIVEANGTRRELVRKAKADLDAMDVNVLGSVLNNRDFPIPDYLYKRL